jgi:hypothetical protein
MLGMGVYPPFELSIIFLGLDVAGIIFVTAGLANINFKKY